MLIALKAVGGWLFKALVTPVLWMWAGATWAAKRAAEKNAKVKDAQAKVAANRPRDRDDLVKRLRGSGGL